MRVVHVPEICFLFGLVWLMFVWGWFFLIRQIPVSTEPSKSALAVSTCIDNLADEGKNNYFCGFDALRNLLKFLGLILDT